MINNENKVFQYDGLAEIVDVANYWNADLFVSIHCNACDSLAHGTETFYCSVEGKKLANCIQRRIISKTGTLNRGIKPVNFFVIRNVDCPAVLVEVAFIDKPVDKTS